MIRDLEAYERIRVAEELRALRKLTEEESIAIAEALLTSSLMAQFNFTDAPRPLNLVRSLRIDPSRVVRTTEPIPP